jgi:hypothetical protein
MMNRRNPLINCFEKPMRGLAIVFGCVSLMATIPAGAMAQASGDGREQATVERWRSALQQYVLKLEGDKYRGDFVIEGYLGPLDWRGDQYEEVTAGRYFAFSVRFRDKNDLGVEVVTTRAVLIDDSGHIVGDIEYPNSQLVWPGTRQPYLFGIPALRSTGWRSMYANWLEPGRGGRCPSH